VAEVDEPEAAASEMSVPVPESAAVWGLPLALSLTLTDPVRVPEAVGLNVTLMVQLLPAATLPLQVLV